MQPTSEQNKNSLWAAAVAAAAGVYVIWSELTFKGSSTLTPVLMALGIGIVALAVAHYLVHRG